MNKNQFNMENQCELSYELLYLLKWLIENESQTLKKTITRAMHNGLREKLTHGNRSLNPMDSQSIQNSIVDFLDLLDSLLHEELNEESMIKVLAQNLSSSINKIDVRVCDKTTVQYSLEKATHQLEDHPNANPKEVLFKEILKQWKPNNKKNQN